MSDTGAKDVLELGESQRKGTVKLPYCDLEINYKSKGEPKMEKEEEPSRPVDDTKRRGLVDILRDIPDIENPEVREALILRLPRPFQNSLRRRLRNTEADLIQIVAKVERLPRLRDGTRPIDILINTAILLARETETEGELYKALSSDYVERYLLSTAPQPDSEDAP